MQCFCKYGCSAFASMGAAMCRQQGGHFAHKPPLSFGKGASTKTQLSFMPCISCHPPWKRDWMLGFPFVWCWILRMHLHTNAARVLSGLHSAAVPMPVHTP